MKRRRRSICPDASEEETATDSSPNSQEELSDEGSLSQDSEETVSIRDPAEDSVEDLGCYEQVDVSQLCQLPIGEQDKIVAQVKQRERDRYNSERNVAIGNPEMFSQKHVGNFLKEAKFSLELKRGRLNSAPTVSDVLSPNSKVYKISTEADRRYVYEREPTDDDAASKKLSKPAGTEATKQKSWQPTMGQMLPGESILEACQRLKQRKQPTKKAKTNAPDTQETSNPEEAIEWETIPSMPPS